MAIQRHEVSGLAHGRQKSGSICKDRKTNERFSNQMLVTVSCALHNSRLLNALCEMMEEQMTIERDTIKCYSQQ
jgi:hypothetical protein